MIEPQKMTMVSEANHKRLHSYFTPKIAGYKHRSFNNCLTNLMDRYEEMKEEIRKLDIEMTRMEKRNQEIEEEDIETINEM